MRNRHIVFFSSPHAPHANPTFPIVSTLVRRGYRVTYLTSDKLASRARETGADVVCCKTWATPNVAPEDRFDQHPRINVLNMDGICRATLRLLGDVTPLFEKDRPDAVIYDLVQFAGRILANRFDLPAIQISPQFALDAENIADQIPDIDFREWVIKQGRKADDFLSRYGIAGDLLYHREGLNLYSFPKIFQPQGAALTDDSCFFAGRCAAEQSYYGDWQPTHSDGRPIALVSTSTTYVRDPQYFKECIAALTGLQWHVLLSIGDQSLPAALGPLPPHVEIVQHTSHIKIFPHATLFVFMAGTTSTAEATYHGVPMIATTCGFAELEWCAENSIVSLGLGVHIKKADFNQHTLRHAAIRIADDAAMRANVRRVSRLVRHEPGAEEVANRIDDYLESRLG